MTWALLIALAAAATDPAPTRLAVAPLRGKGGDVCAKALSEVFAERVRIVTLDASVEGLTNWDELSEWIEKNGAPGADVVIVGSLNNASIVLEAYATHDKRLIGLKSVETAGRCKFSEQTRRLLIAWLDSVLPEPVPASQQKRAVEKQTAAPAEEAAVEQKAEAQATPEVEKKPERSFAVAVAGSIAIGRRGLSFVGTTTPNLRAYEVDVMPVPQLALEAYPLAGLDVWEYFRPLGLAATFARTVGLSSTRIEGGPELDTVHTELSATLLYRWRVPLSSLRFDLIPQVGYHHLAFGLRGSGGASEPDLPDVAYSSLAFGVGADVPVLERVNVYGAGTYLAVLDGGQIFNAGFFEQGTARGYRIELGMGYRVVEGVILQLAGHYLSYSLSLNPQLGDERVAQSATDSLSGIGLGVRIEL